MIRAELSSDTIASAMGTTVKAPSPVLALCRKLVAQGCNPATPLEAYRGSTLCLTIRSIGEATKLKITGSGTVSMWREIGVQPRTAIIPRYRQQESQNCK